MKSERFGHSNYTWFKKPTGCLSLNHFIDEEKYMLTLESQCIPVVEGGGVLVSKTQPNHLIQHKRLGFIRSCGFGLMGLSRLDYLNDNNGKEKLNEKGESNLKGRLI